MTREELLEKLEQIQVDRCETRTLELKAAKQGCPKRLYDILSSFSNQTEGGTIIFGVDECDDFGECGVYDPQDLQKKIGEQCQQMEPVLRPVLTVAEKDGKFFVAAEIPGLDIADRPCFYRGKGRLQGAFVRVGDSDEPMTEYEVYSYEAFRKKYQDEARPVERASWSAIDDVLLRNYLDRLKRSKPNLSALSYEEICELLSLTRGGELTLCAVMLFGKYPQAYFPQLCITAVAVPGTEVGDLGEYGERFLDNRRLEGNIPAMLEQTLDFLGRNMRTKTIVSAENGHREDRQDYPPIALRELVLNALVHRDYSVHTEGMPIQICLFRDRLEIRSPGGIYGRLQVSQLGKVQPSTRNPLLATALEVMGLTENRYSGIPAARRAMADYGLPEPVFADVRGNFTVTLYGDKQGGQVDELSDKEKELLAFLRVPRSRQEIVEFLGLSSVAYALQTYINPLAEKGLVRMTLPDKPRSRKQRFVRV